MQLEQNLEICQPRQILISGQRKGIYTIVDLEYLSASALYSSRPIGSGPLSSTTPSGPLGHEKFEKLNLLGPKSKWEEETKFGFVNSDIDRILKGHMELIKSIELTKTHLKKINSKSSLPSKPLSSKPLTIKGTGKSFKIFTPEMNTPLTRIDLKSHEYGDMHIQHGKKDYFERRGDEAADIFAEIYRLNPKLKFPWENKDK